MYTKGRKNEIIRHEYIYIYIYINDKANDIEVNHTLIQLIWTNN